MSMPGSAVRAAVIATVVLAGSAGVFTPWLPLPTVDAAEGHRSSLRATVTMADGTVRPVTLQGVGCREALCSRVRAAETTAGSVWLDGLAAIREISHEPEGPVTAVITLKNGVERRASIIQWNRVFYVEGRFGRTERLDLGSVNAIAFD